MVTATLRTALGKYLHTMPLFSGEVTPREATLALADLPNGAGPVLRTMIRNFEFDVSELGLSTAFSAKDWGIPLTPLPIFIARAFDFGAFVVNERLGVTEPRDLEGKKVALGSYTIANAIWARGFLADTFGVDLDSVTWVLTGDEHIAWARLPVNCELRPGANASALLDEGEVVGMLGSYAGTETSVRPLVPDAGQHEKDWLATKGAASIHRVIVVQDRRLEENPGLAEDLYSAFTSAKRPFLDRLAAGAEVLEHPDVEGVNLNVYGTKHTSELPRPDPIPYGLDSSRELLETFVRRAYDQHVLSRPMTLEELFSAGK
jgi:4,5-dihydroxyphthalate decarboxylase